MFNPLLVQKLQSLMVPRWVLLLVPFIEVNPDNDYEAITEVIENVWGLVDGRG